MELITKAKEILKQKKEEISAKEMAEQQKLSKEIKACLDAFEKEFIDYLPMLKEAGIAWSAKMKFYPWIFQGVYIDFETGLSHLHMDITTGGAYRYESPPLGTNGKMVFGKWPKEDFVVWIYENLLKKVDEKTELHGDMADDTTDKTIELYRPEETPIPIGVWKSRLTGMKVLSTGACPSFDTFNAFKVKKDGSLRKLEGWYFPHFEKVDDVIMMNAPDALVFSEESGAAIRREGWFNKKFSVWVSDGEIVDATGGITQSLDVDDIVANGGIALVCPRPTQMAFACGPPASNVIPIGRLPPCLSLCRFV